MEGWRTAMQTQHSSTPENIFSRLVFHPTIPLTREDDSCSRLIFKSNNRRCHSSSFTPVNKPSLKLRLLCCNVRKYSWWNQCEISTSAWKNWWKVDRRCYEVTIFGFHFYSDGGTVSVQWASHIPSCGTDLAISVLEFNLSIAIYQHRLRKGLQKYMFNWNKFKQHLFSMFLIMVFFHSFAREMMQNIRCEQGSNLRGKIPLDFKSNALTTRPSQHGNGVTHSHNEIRQMRIE